MDSMLVQLQSALNSTLLGKKNVTRMAVCCMLANGHLLLEDLPGMGKTTLSHALAHFTGMEYRRIQFTSDLLPTDLIGVSVFDQEKNTFVFHKGPIFSQLILADEINRATPKTQSALLEAMEEKQVTTDEGTLPLAKPFFVIATQNPSYQTGTYPLPESQLDRFLMRLEIGYPTESAERTLLEQNGINSILEDSPPVLSPETFLNLQIQCRNVIASAPIITYIQRILSATRKNDWFHHGLSPRAGLSILRAAQGWAITDERDYIKAEDIAETLPSVVNHRLIQKEQGLSGSPAYQLLNHCEIPL
jgi:MoxR-like ATPase